MFRPAGGRCRCGGRRAGAGFARFPLRIGGGLAAPLDQGKPAPLTRASLHPGPGQAYTRDQGKPTPWSRRAKDGAFYIRSPYFCSPAPRRGRRLPYRPLVPVFGVPAWPIKIEDFPVKRGWNRYFAPCRFHPQGRRFQAAGPAVSGRRAGRFAAILQAMRPVPPSNASSATKQCI